MVLTCRFCGIIGDRECNDFQIDHMNRGFFCEWCDGYSYIDPTTPMHRFTLILEDPTIEKTITSAPKHFSKRLSPYRYPGGKSKIIDYLYSHLHKEKTIKLVSPFTGGGSFELAMLQAGVIEKLHLNDKDFGVYSLWWAIKYMPFALIERLQSIEPTHKDYFKYREVIRGGYKGVDLIDAAWCSLVVNRLAYSGISKANPLGGKKGDESKLLSRWRPYELVKRIEAIHQISDKIEISNLDGISIIEEMYWDESSTIFIDPPYVNKGKALYDCYYTENEHRQLAQTLDSLHHGFPGADLVVTYDYSKWLERLYEYPETNIIGRIYSA